VKATINLFQKQLENFKELEENKKKLVKYIFNISTDKNVKYLQDLIFSFF
jgi:hypothetical protein